MTEAERASVGAPRAALVSGAGGFIGANLVRRLLADGHRVEAIVRPGADHWRLEDLRGEIRLNELDVRDREAVAGLVERLRPEWVFHLATHGAYSTQADVERIFETALGGTINLLEACLEAGFEAFVSTGSSSEYGLSDHAPAESEALRPNSHYAVAKAAASMYCSQSAIANDAHVVSLRLYSAYGPWEEPSRFIPTLISRGLEGRLPPLVSPGVARDFVHVDDVVSACLLAARDTGVDRGSVFNVGTGRQTTIEQVVAMARRLLAIAAEPRWGSMDDRCWDTDVWVADSTLIRRELGWSPRWNLEDGLTATAEWLRSRPAIADRYRREASGP